MTSERRMLNSSRPIRILWVGLCLLLPLNACTCEDETGADPWALSDPWPEDMSEPVLDPDMAVELDMAVEPDLPPEPVEIPPDIPWEKEVVAEVSQTQALNDRTSLGVGDDGTVWLGFHSCRDFGCAQSYLSVASREPASGDWGIEEVTPQRGTFGLDVFGDQPWVAYLDEINGQFRVGNRSPTNGAWSLEPLPVNFTGPYDGLDITHDNSRIYVTFASSSNDPVDLFAMDLRAGVSEWFELAKLDVGDASAALERGLSADDNGNLFLVHRDGDSGPYGVARYKLRDNIWDRQSYYNNPSIIASSMVARQSGDICLSNTVSGGFIGDGTFEVTCGKINNLRRDVWGFSDETVSSYTSMIEGREGSLIVAFNTGGNSSLRVGRRYPDGTWDFRTVFDGPSYGVSTAIDTENKLWISYYTCSSGGRCTLETLRQPYE